MTKQTHLLDEKAVAKNKRKYVQGYLMRGLKGETFSSVEQTYFDRALSWATKFQVGYRLWLLAQIVITLRFIFPPRQ